MTHTNTLFLFLRKLALIYGKCTIPILNYSLTYKFPFQTIPTQRTKLHSPPCLSLILTQ